jgi:hypothetical protein
MIKIYDDPSLAETRFRVNLPLPENASGRIILKQKYFKQKP